MDRRTFLEVASATSVGINLGRISSKRKQTPDHLERPNQLSEDTVASAPEAQQMPDGLTLLRYNVQTMVNNIIKKNDIKYSKYDHGIGGGEISLNWFSYNFHTDQGEVEISMYHCNDGFRVFNIGHFKRPNHDRSSIDIELLCGRCISMNETLEVLSSITENPIGDGLILKGTKSMRGIA